MSITFFIAGSDGRSVYRCDCSERWCAACDVAWERDERAPDMYTCENCTDTEINMANMNAMEFMAWVDLAVDYGGQVSAKELAARCRRRLWDEARNHDPMREGSEYKFPGGPMIIECERRPDYLRSQTERMLKVCEKAGDNLIAWG
jgi:hypothetical protein